MKLVACLMSLMQPWRATRSGKQKWTLAAWPVESPRRMKNQMGPAVMLAVMFLCVLCTSAFLVRYFFALKQLHALQQSFNTATRNVRLAGDLGRECLEYSKKNPAMETLLRRFSNSRPRAITGTTRSTRSSRLCRRKAAVK